MPASTSVRTSAPGRGDNQAGHVNRLAVFIYGGGAVFLAPWIVVLYLSQHQEADGYHLKLTSLGMSVFTVIGLLVGASAFHQKLPIAVVWISSATTYLFISTWFDTITANHHPLALALIYEFWVKVPLIAFSIWFVVKMTRKRGSNVSIPRWFPIVCIAAVVVLIPLFILAASVSPRTEQLHNLQLFWTGLDGFELIGMALTGWFILRRSPVVAAAATITGTLLFSDAWFNVVTTVGKPHRAALLMAFVEVPTAAYSFIIARREISSWSVDMVASPAPGNPG